MQLVQEARAPFPREIISMVVALAVRVNKPLMRVA